MTTEVKATDRLRLAQTSRFRRSSLYPEIGPSFGRWPISKEMLPYSESDTYHTVVSGEEYRLDLIAYRVYQSTFLWWAIALVNDIKNPFTAPEVGDVLRIPSPTTVLSVLSRGR